MKHLKHFLSVFLTLALVFAALPAGVFAAGEDVQPSADTTVPVNGANQTGIGTDTWTPVFDKQANVTAPTVFNFTITPTGTTNLAGGTDKAPALPTPPLKGQATLTNSEQQSITFDPASYTFEKPGIYTFKVTEDNPSPWIPDPLNGYEVTVRVVPNGAAAEQVKYVIDAIVVKSPNPNNPNEQTKIATEPVFVNNPSGSNILRITKQVAGNAYNKTFIYDFEVSATGLTPNSSYNITVPKEFSVNNEEKIYTLTADKDGNASLPENAPVQVTNVTPAEPCTFVFDPLPQTAVVTIKEKPETKDLGSIVYKLDVKAGENTTVTEDKQGGYGDV